MENESAFSNYWARKTLLNKQAPSFPVRRWRAGEDLCEIERLYLDVLKDKMSVLDVGAGDLRVKNKFLQAGYSGEYHTQDISSEHQHTYSDLTKVQQTYDAILCLDVIEHLSFQEGMQLIKRLHQLLNPGGVVILQTPNARCIRNPLSWDMTHLHCYNLPDLWSLYMSEGYLTEGYRVVFESDAGILGRLYSLVGRFIITRFLGADYADNIALIAHKGLKS